MIDNSAWGKDAVTASGNVLVSPDGYANADIIVEDTALGNHRITRSVSFVSGTTYASSCFVKQGSGTRRILIFFGNTAFGSNLFVNFNIQTGTITPSSSSITGKIENYGNGWFRCIAIATATSTNSATNAIYLRQTDAASSATYTGDGTSSMYIWGLQCEAGTHATSYIPTTAATVTRNADSAFDTGISSLLGQTEGTVFIDMSHSANISARSIFAIDINATTNFIAGTINNSNAVVFQVRQSGSSTSIITSSALSLGRHKIAFAYKSGDYALYIDGVQIGTSNSTVYPVGTLDQLVFSSANYGQLGDKFNQNIVFKTRLTNTELATLTTL
jgi:hypothetical protein